MKKNVLLLLATCVALSGTAQFEARLVFNNGGGGDPFMVFDPTATTNTTYLVIENPYPTAIVQLPAGSGNIKSENENNRIRWDNAGQVGTYVVPWTTQSGVKIPLSITKSTAGTGPVGHDSLSFVLATYNHQVVAGADWNNNLYKPTGVTHMNDYFLGSVDNSMNAVNRFWIVDPKATAWAYTTSPSVAMTFINDNADIDNTGVTPGVDRDALFVGAITNTPLQAQRFNTGLNKWGDYLSAPVSAFAANFPTAGRATVSNVVATNANFYRAWTLSSIADPLPIELTNWEGVCEGKEVKLSWTTATETNSDFFTIEKSLDAQTWEVIGEVAAAGNSLGEMNYSFVDENTAGLAYYRLSQTDNDGERVDFQVVAAGCEANSTEIVSAWDDGNNVNVLVSSTEGGIYDVYFTDAAGKTMVTRGSQVINKNFTQLSFNKNGIARGMYTITLQNADNVMSRRVVLM